MKLTAWQGKTLQRLFGRPPPRRRPAVLAVRREWSFLGEHGEEILGDGYNLHDADGAAIHFADVGVALPGALIFKVAGVSYRPDALQSDCFMPGRDVVLVPEPDNPGDKNAVAVRDEGRSVHLGYVPRELAESVCRDLGSGTKRRGICIWQWRNIGGARVGVEVLFGPGLAELELG